MATPTEPLPIVLKQLWIVTMPDGQRFEGGASYHLTEPHRVAYVQSVAGRLSGPDSEREEPIHEAFPVHVRDNFYREIVAQGGSFRVK